MSRILLIDSCLQCQWFETDAANTFCSKGYCSKMKGIQPRLKNLDMFLIGAH